MGASSAISFLTLFQSVRLLAFDSGIDPPFSARGTAERNHPNILIARSVNERQHTFHDPDNGEVLHPKFALPVRADRDLVRMLIYERCVGEVESMLSQVRFALRLVPFV